MELRSKVCLLGDQRVGKTSLIKRYIEGEFTSDYSPTLGADFVEKRFTHDKLTELKKSDFFSMFIWDLAGQSHFEEIASFYVQKSAGIILIYDVNDLDSFHHLYKWKQLCDKYTANAQIMVVGNKTDLQNVIPPEKIENLEHQLGIKIHLASAKLDQNVSDIFIEMAKLLITQYKP
jgi:small GTP-binding protein